MNEEFEEWWKLNGSDNWVGKRWARAAWEDRQDEIDKIKQAAKEVLNAIHEKNLYSAPLPRQFWGAFDNLRSVLEKK